MSIRDYLLTKFAINGFSVYYAEEKRFIIRPRGMEDTAEMLIEWGEGDRPVVIASDGRYAGKRRREFFQRQLDAWYAEAQLAT